MVWVVLILGFGLELTTALVHADWLRAFISFCAMVGIMTVALHWPQLRTWASRINPNWVIGAFIALLISVALLPFIEEGRWPFAAWFDVATEAQNTMLNDRLKQTQQERDQTIVERNSAQASWATDLKRLQAAQSQLADAQQEIEKLKNPPLVLTPVLPLSGTVAHLGPINTLNAFGAAESIASALADDDASILITSTPGNDNLRKDLNAILDVGARKAPHRTKVGYVLQPPTYERDIDAPKLPSSGYSGIIIHGDTSKYPSFNDLFQNCFVIRKSTKTVDGLAQYYGIGKVVWIEIGEGSPWRAPGRCDE